MSTFTEDDTQTQIPFSVHGPASEHLIAIQGSVGDGGDMLGYRVVTGTLSPFIHVFLDEH